MRKKTGKIAANEYLEMPRILLGVLITLLAVIAAGTAVALFSKPRAERATANNTALPHGGTATQRGGAAEQTVERIWTGLGTVRAPIGNAKYGETKAVAVISIGFPYDPADKTFQEELALNVGKFREETQKYFLGIDTSKNPLPSEDKIKQDLLALFNSRLRLGQIKTLYFSEFMLLE